ncbi:MAG: hypothetical protein K5744_02935 [Eubacterium sp.]|nr:hypothetical protein [Eubacterium sp.]
MKRIKLVICIILGSVMILGGLVALNWFDLLCSSEYYKGFDWNTNEKELEQRLPKEYSWEEGEYRNYTSKVYYPKEYPDTWCQEHFYLDADSNRLKEVEIYYIAKDATGMNLIYDTERGKLSKKLGDGIEYEWRSAICTEWKEKKSTIRIIKSDCEYDDSNDIVRVIYLDNKECAEPVFTEKHLDKNTFETMLNKFFCVANPDYSVKGIDFSKETDFSYFKLSSTEETRKAVALMNKHLFAEDPDGSARTVADAEGITEESPMTVEWVMDHPVRAVKLWDELVRNLKKEDFLKSRNVVDEEYALLTKEEKKRA